MPNAEPPEFPTQIVPLSGHLPADLAAYRVRLAATQTSVATFGRYMDGYFLGFVGADGMISLVPVVGDVLGGLMTAWLVVKATQVRMPLGERVVMVGLGVLDVAIGMVPGAGDVADFVFRSHVWSARRLQAHIAMQLEQIDAVGPLPDGHPQAERLRDALFRGGRTRQEVWWRFGVIGAVCALALGYCAYQADQAARMRQERILACEARGQWFCSWTY